MNMVYKCARKIKNIIFNKRSFYILGDYVSWEKAANDCVGYDDEKIFDKVSKAAIEVKKGNAVFERDSVLFYEKAYNYPLIAWINKMAIEKNGHISVVDWGGSLGSTYYQNKDMLPDNILWNVIEQKHFVDFGKRELKDGSLDFLYNLSEIKQYECVLLSGVLQFITDYKGLLKDIFERQVEYIILERTPFYHRDRICKQVVKEPIYDASYVSYLFEENRINDIFIQNGYELYDSWESLVDGQIKLDGNNIIFKSLVYKKK